MSRIFEIAQRTNCCYSNTTTMSHGLSQDEIDDLKEAFNMFDVDGGGSISKEELKGVMKKLGSDPTDDEIQAMINSVDDNGDGEIDFDEFLVLMSAKKKNGKDDPDKELKDAFKVFDADGSGTISRAELQKLMKSLGQNLSDAELGAMMDEVDTDKSGEIDFAEFKSMMMS
mmetsp:Transcript_12701/g.21548  ORF Transcript_12701/g.21548 Transcript_12701/m.21548 type:complete len:171 (-) Transcript_12701:282-794(-)